MGHSRTALLLFSVTLGACAWGQTIDSTAVDSSKDAGSASTPAPTPTPAPTKTPSPESDDSRYASDVPSKFLRNFGHDQKDIWTSPFKARIQDLNWIAPLTGLSVGLMNADAEISSRESGTGSLSKHSSTLSNGGLPAARAGAERLYLRGEIK